MNKKYNNGKWNTKEKKSFMFYYNNNFIPIIRTTLS